MELFVSGVKVPKLGSIQDVMARAYLTKKTVKEVNLNKLLAHIAVGVGRDDKKWSDGITKIWNNYVNLAYFLEDIVEQQEADMREEFEFWKDVRPVLKADKDGLKLTDMKKIDRNKKRK